MKDITDLQKMKNFIKGFPGFDILNEFNVDYTDQIPSSGGIFPTGIMELERHEDVMGNITVANQYNFGIYCVFAKDKDLNAEINADWVIDFQKWVQEQGIRGRVPKFGNTGEKELIKAQNGMLYDQTDEGTATYMIQLSVEYKTFFEEE